MLCFSAMLLSCYDVVTRVVWKSRKICNAVITVLFFYEVFLSLKKIIKDMLYGAYCDYVTPTALCVYTCVFLA